MPRAAGRAAPVTLALDPVDGPKVAGDAVRGVLGTRGALRLAVAYVTRELAVLLAIPKSRYRDVTLICDPFSGACDPALLQRLAASGVRVLAREHFHAKVYIGPGGVAMGSANLSAVALRKGQDEGVVQLTDPAVIAEAAAWFDAVAAAALPLEALVRDPIRWAHIEGLWAQQRALATRGSALNLLEALRDPWTNDVRHLAFEFTVDAVNTEDQRAAARARADAGLVDRADWESLFSVTEAPPRGETASAYVKRLRAATAGKVIHTFWATSDNETGVLREIESLDEAVHRVEAIQVTGGQIYTFYAPLPRPPYRLGRAADSLIAALNDALKAGNKAGAALSAHEFASAAQLAALLPPMPSGTHAMTSTSAPAHSFSRREL